MARDPKTAIAPTTSGPGSFVSGPGQELPLPTRLAMQRTFGADFSDVRVHQCSPGTANGAFAFAQGRDIHFAPGQYDPHSQSGMELIGHELSHVVQQRQGRVTPVADGLVQH
jgi:hypothetical protein